MATVPSDQKFHTIAANVATKERGSSLVNSQKEIFTMDDITSTVRPYNVFTALLTQSGGDNQSYVENFTTAGSTQNIVKGVTYYIDVNTDNVDFSSIGAPSNAEGTYFIATENKINTDFPNLTWALGYNTGAPVATVLENTIGNVWFSYNDVGQYYLNSNALFTLNKIFSIVNANTDAATGAIIGIAANYSNNNILITSGDPILGSTYDGFLSNTPIEIRVYE